MPPFLPIGLSNFPSLRLSNTVYVDKTKLICGLAAENQRLFLVRPRRFGKSLLLSTFESLFQDGLKYFAGLEAEKIWNDQTYQVVRIDFSPLKIYRSYSDFQTQLESRIRSAFARAGFDYRPESGILFFDALESWLLSLKNASLVLLVDEYDAPLTAHIDDSDVFSTIKQLLAQFYGIIKSADQAFRFVFITGITKFQGTSIFSEFNNLQDLTLQKDYGALLGYTDSEIKRFFPEYLEASMKTLGLTEHELMELMRKHYDGYCFEETCTQHVFTPWSVLSFFKTPSRGFKPYWYDSAGQPAVLLKFLTHHALSHPEYYDSPKIASYRSLAATQNYENIDETTLLVQTGYLTLKHFENDVFTLGYPNKEVATAMAQLYCDELLRNASESRLKLARLPKILANGTLEEIVALFNTAFEAVNYQDYPVTSEHACRAFLHVLLLGAAMVTTAEFSNAHGRSDLEVEAGDRHWIFELKFATGASAAQRQLDDALEQIRSRRYGAGHLSERRIIRAALVFDGRARRFTHCAELLEESPRSL